MLSLKSLSFALALVACVVVVAVSCEKQTPMQYAMAKLELMASRGLSRSSLDMIDLRKAHKEYQSWTRLQKEEGKRSPLMRLFVNFAIIPLDHYEDQVNTKKTDLTFEVLYVDRLDKAYKSYRNCYLGRICGDRSYLKSPKIDMALMALLTPEAPLNKKLLVEAKVEYDAFKARLSEIETEDDIYANQSEYMHTYNLMNRDIVKALVKSCFSNMDLADSSPSLLRRRLQDEMGPDVYKRIIARMHQQL